MPALLLHMTLARDAASRPDVPPRLATAARVAPDALLLGSVLPDLPYHGRFLHQLVRHLSGQEYLPSEWGDVFHTRSTGKLALGLLAHAARSHLSDGETNRVLALTTGYVSHHAVDRTVHPAINRLVKRERVRGEKEPGIRTHERLERWQSLFYHEDLLGEQIAGGGYSRTMVARMAGAGMVNPALDPTLWRAFRAACLETHGRCPTAGQLSDWLWGTTAYSVLFASPFGRLERPRGDVERLRATTYQGPDVDLVTPLEQAQQATIRSFQAMEQLLTSDRITNEVREVFLTQVGDVDLGTGY